MGDSQFPNMEKSLLALLVVLTLAQGVMSLILVTSSYDASPDCMRGKHPDSVSQEFVGVNGTITQTSWCNVHRRGATSPGLTADKYTLSSLGGNERKYTICTSCDPDSSDCAGCKSCMDESIPSAGSCMGSKYASNFVRVIEDLPAKGTYSVPSYLYQGSTNFTAPVKSWSTRPLGCSVSQQPGPSWVKQNATKKADAVVVDIYTYEGSVKWPQQPKCNESRWVYVTSYTAEPPQLIWVD